MKPYLLDVNVLIALIDTLHVRHHDAHQWFRNEGQHGWATCPLTENGALRIVGDRRYPNSPGTPAVVAESLVSLRKSAGYAFWKDDLSLLDTPTVQMTRISDTAQITDTYLLALAALHGGLLATFDRRMVTNAVSHGPKTHYQIG